MKTTLTLLLTLLTSLLLACNSNPPTLPTAQTPSSPSPVTGGYSIAGPFDHQNLTLFLISAPQANKSPDKNYLTLNEALQQKKVTVNETGSVNELTIENTSNDDIYIQSGEIVKGGRQDRTLQNDLVLAPHSGKIPVAAFCVEHGRWQQRGSENAAQFDSSAQSLSSKSLKLSAKSANDQGMVWGSVAVEQQKMSENAGKSVNSPQSSSSLQLSLEDKDVQKAVEAYKTALQKIAKDRPNVVGYAFAINGKLNSIDIYSSHSLFTKMWDKNLQAAATEAFADYKKDAHWQPLPPAAVSACIADAATAKTASTNEVHKVTLVTRESASNRAFETYAPGAPTTAAPAHLNIITRDPETDKMLQSNPHDNQLQNQRGNLPVQRPVPQQQNAPANQ